MIRRVQDPVQIPLTDEICVNGEKEIFLLYRQDAFDCFALALFILIVGRPPHKEPPLVPEMWGKQAKGQ
jgi:hypothetical protein